MKNDKTISEETKVVEVFSFHFDSIIDNLKFER